MKPLIVIMSTMAVASIVMFIGAFQACTTEVTESGLLDVQVLGESDDSSSHEVQIVSDVVLDVVKTEELDLVEIDVIEFTEEETSDIFDTEE